MELKTLTYGQKSSNISFIFLGRLDTITLLTILDSLNVY